MAAGSVSGGVTGNQLTLTQTGSRAVIDWQSFNINAGKTVQFVQDSTTAAVLNRVSASAGLSEIYGTLTANGMVLLMNPNGVLFGAGANINVGSLIATTGTINQSDFMGGGAIAISGATAGSVTNRGTITAEGAGLVALVAPSVSNQGIIAANGGTVLLAGVSAATISMNGGLYEFVTGAAGAKVANSGTIQADGGTVLLTAANASAILDNVINMDGIIQARTVGSRNGSIILEGGDAGSVQVTGRLDATGTGGTTGGKITVTGNSVELAATARLDASGDAGGGTVLVGGNWQGKGPERNAQTTTVAAGATLRADAVSNGDGGKVVVWADGATRFNGEISSRGGAAGGDGGAVEVSGKRSLGYAGMVDTSAANGSTGSLLLDPDLAVISNAADGTAGDTWTINAASLVSTLNSTEFTVQANTNAKVDAAVNAGGNANAHNLTFIAPTVDLNAAITLKSGSILSGTASTVNVNGSNARIQNGVDVAASGGTVNVNAGTYAAETINITKALTLRGQILNGQRVAKLQVADNTDAISINANNVTVSGLELAGPVTESYVTYPWVDGIVSRGIFVHTGYSGFAITNNNIHDVRTGIVIDGRNGVGNVVTGNRIDNTKSAISVQYTDGSGIAISGNTQGNPVDHTGWGNEWGLNLHLNGYFIGATRYDNPIAAAPTLDWQQTLLNLSTANNGWAVQDQGYTLSNRTQVMVTTTGNPSKQGSLREPLSTIQGGINAVVTGGQVNVATGTYAENVSITKALTLKGAGAANSIIDPASGDAVAVSGAIGASSTVLIDGFTFRDAPGAGVSVASGTTLGQLTIQNSDFLVNGHFGFTADGSTTAGIPGLANVSLLNSTFEGNGAPYTSAASLGQGDIHFNYYNGNATLKDLTITGNTEHVGIQFRGYHNASGGAVHDAGTLVFDNVTIGGSFRRPSGSAGTWNPSGPGDAIHILEYASVANMSFNNVAINPTVGHGMFLEGLSSTLNIGNTRFGLPDRSITGTGIYPTLSFNVVAGSNDQNNVRTNVNATSAVFTGATSGFDVEDRVAHALDVSGLGLVSWNAGNVYVTQTSGSIQRGLDAAGVGNSVNVAAGSYAENLVLNNPYKLYFNGSTVHSLTLNAAAGGTGIAGRVTADEAGGFLFNAPINLLGDSTLTTLGANIALNGHVQNTDGVRYSLTLAAGSGSNRGDVSMTSGGSESSPLNQFEVTSNRFNLSDTLWVQRYKINALGDVALSGHTLRGQDPGAANTMSAGGNVTGSTINLGRVEIASGGDISANVSGSDVAVTAQGDLNVVVTASRTATLSGDSVVATVTAPVVAVDAVHDAQISGSASNITVDAPSGHLTGDFPQVTNGGGGLVNVNGKPQGNQTLIANSENNRVIPAGNTEPDEGVAIQMAQAGGLIGQGLAPRSLSGPGAAGSFIDRGQAVELDLSPRNERKKK